MRFIINFFFFGLLFYLIYLYFPEAFQTLTHWASNVVVFFKGIFQTGMDAVHGKTQHTTETTTTTTSFLLPAIYSVKTWLK